MAGPGRRPGRAGSYGGSCWRSKRPLILRMPFEAGVYHSYEQVAALLREWESSFPELCDLSSIGECADGKQIWLLTITEKATGAHGDKPAFWCDANMHAGEVTGCEAALHLIHTLVTRWAAGDTYTRTVLSSSTIYCLPRMSADGAEYMLTTPYYCRSSPIQLDPVDYPGFVAKDIDGNGRCTMMRKKDPSGPFKQSNLDARLLVHRLPHDRDPNGVYYRVWPEGEYRGDYDGFQQTVAQGAAFTLDSNRQWPFNYDPEGVQRGAGPYPGFLPQARAVTVAVTERNNIACLMNYHTFGNMVIRPPQEELGADWPAYASLTQVGVQETGYA
jgi:hypothetical protein